MSRFYIVLIVMLFLGNLAKGQQGGKKENVVDWKQLTTVEAVCTAYPDRVRALLTALNLDDPKLAAVKAAMAAENLPAAAGALLEYYRTGPRAAWLRAEPAPPGHGRDESADRILNDTFLFYSQAGQAPRLADGRLDWSYRGPTNDQEWAWALNRHHHLRDLYQTYRKTGNRIYADAIDAHLRDWVVSSLPYPREKRSTALWRGLEASFRVKAWAELFYGLQPSEALQSGTRLLLLTSLPEHAHYLRHFHAGGNWMTMELSALAMLAAAWPEFKESRAWMSYAKEQLANDLKQQVYPDGVQTELSASYHWVALHNFAQLADICRAAGEPLPDGYPETLERMYQYLAYVLAPDGAVPLNNDSDRHSMVQNLLKAAEQYRRPDWQYIVTNGTAGTAPAGLPSVMFPWAGQLIMRDGWGADAQWAFFDAGPWGTGHQHNDMLHVSVRANGRDLLVDSGRFSYRGEVAERYRAAYALHARAHNVILLDGLGQVATPPKAGAPLDTFSLQPAFDFCLASYTAGYSGQLRVTEQAEIPARHTRAVIYLRGAGWVVFDRIAADQPRTIEALWHFHPSCTVQTAGVDSATTDAGQGNLRIVPVGDLPWSAQIVKGQMQPYPQGWYSYQYNSVEASPCAVYTVKAPAVTTFAWLLVPGKDVVAKPQVALLPSPAGSMRLRATFPGGTPVEVAVRLDGDAPVPLSGGLALDGRCAVLRDGQPPLVACGRLVNAQGQVVASDPAP